MYVEDRKKESMDQRRKSEKLKPNEHTFIDVCVWMWERDIAHRPLRMCRYIWLSTRREWERNIDARIHLWISINLSSCIDTAYRMDSDDDQRTRNSFQIFFFFFLFLSYWMNTVCIIYINIFYFLFISNHSMNTFLFRFQKLIKRMSMWSFVLFLLFEILFSYHTIFNYIHRKSVSHLTVKKKKKTAAFWLLQRRILTRNWEPYFFIYICNWY